jgi:hypothetical protein
MAPNSKVEEMLEKEKIEGRSNKDVLQFYANHLKLVWVLSRQMQKNKYFSNKHHRKIGIQAPNDAKIVSRLWNSDLFDGVTNFTLKPFF